MLTQPKARFSKPMSTGDSTLMMLLSLNLLLLVFFVLLNSMATKDKKHSDSVMAQLADGYGLPAAAPKAAAGDSQDVPLTGWRAGVVTKIQGMVNNRFDLRVMPQQGNAGKIEIELPLSALFDSSGVLVRPETLRNIAAAAGSESRIIWQVKGRFDDAARLAMYASALAVENGRAEVVAANTDGLRVIITPGLVAPSNIGLQIQQVGEDAGGTVQGVQDKETVRE